MVVFGLCGCDDRANVACREGEPPEGINSLVTQRDHHSSRNQLGSDPGFQRLAGGVFFLCVPVVLPCKAESVASPNANLLYGSGRECSDAIAEVRCRVCILELATGHAEKLLLSEWGITLNAKDTLGKALVLAVSKALGISESKAAGIVETRLTECKEGGEEAAILGSSEALESLDKADEEVVQKFVADFHAEQNNYDDIVEFVRSMRKDIKKKRKPVAFPAPSTQWSPAQVLELAPQNSNCKCIKDPFNGRWRLWYGPVHKATKRQWSVSRSWGLNGTDHDCVQHILSEVWKLHTRLSGEPCFLTGLDKKVQVCQRLAHLTLGLLRVTATVALVFARA